MAGLEATVDKLTTKDIFRDLIIEKLPLWVVGPYKKGPIHIKEEKEIGKTLFGWFGEIYLAGHSIDEGLEAVEDFYDQGRLSTLDALGEGGTSEAEAERYFDAYVKMIDKVAALHVKKDTNDVSSISLKPSAICYCEESKADEAGMKTVEFHHDLTQRLRNILQYAKNKGVNVTLDMEDHPYTDISLEVAKTMWEEGFDNLGIVLQSRLNRTDDDITTVLANETYEGIDKSKIRVRECIGIYKEPNTIAIDQEDKPAMKEKLKEQVKQLYDAGVYVEVATHDPDTVRDIVADINARGLDKTRFEFQFLKGVRKGYDLENELRAEGFKTRFYMPVELKEGDGIPYMQRRLRNNPEMIDMAIKNVFDELKWAVFHPFKATKKLYNFTQKLYRS
jgi:proline dehydrogenase